MTDSQTNSDEQTGHTAAEIMRSGIWFGAIFAAIGLFIYVMVRLDPSRARAPEFVIDAAAGVFFFAGVSIIGQALRMPIVGRIASLAVVYLMAVPGFWMLLGDDAGQCSVSIAIAGVSSSGAGDPGMCRMVFGAGAIIVLGMALLFTALAIRDARQKRDPGTSGARAE
ncbi:hypothetical protein [Devosia sp.]|uniref:hypothetical protein n=1 Tax=Devosia sp. TaxID=1871048 RepID=UPI003A8E14BD